MSLSLFGYDNILENASITATSESIGFEAANIADWLPYDWYSPSTLGTNYINIDIGVAKEVDYFAIFSHDLGKSGATVKLQYDNTGLGNWIDATTALTSDNGRVIFEKFSEVTKQIFRIEIVAPSALPMIGIVSIGKSMQMENGLPSGFIPPHMGTQSDYVNNKSDSGLLLGRSLIRKSNGSTIKAKYVTPAWVRSSWMPFLKHAEAKPFFFSWNHVDYPDEAVFCTTSKKISPPVYSDSMYMSISLSVEAWHEL